jgi:hypothetical protein
MGTLQDMITRVGAELRRPDLVTGGQIASAINDAIVIYQKDRFRFSDAGPTAPPTFNTVAGQWIYGAGSNSNIPTWLFVEALNVVIGNTTQELTRLTPEEIYLLNQQGTQSGQPINWAYDGNSVIFYPIPSQAWPIIMVGHILVPAPAELNTPNNPWMNEAEQLIRSRAKYEIALHVTRNATMAQDMSPDQDGGRQGKPGATWRAWRMLKGETAKVKGSGRIVPMRF